MKPEIMRMKVEPKGSVLQIYIYSEVAGDGYNWWGDRVPSETSAASIRDAITENAQCSTLDLFVNSCGGSVLEGYGIYSQLKRFPGKVTAYVDGFANSIASVICMAADEVKMYQNSIMTIHNVSTGIWGNAAQLRAEADALDRIMEGNRKAYLAHAKGKLDEATLIELLDAETVLTAEDAYGYGLCDTIIDKDADMTQAEEMMQREHQRLQMAASHGRLMQMTGDPAGDHTNTTNQKEQKVDDDVIAQLFHDVFGKE